MLAMIIIIGISDCVELNKVSPQTQSFINIFLYFYFSLFSTSPNLPALLKVEAYKLCGEAALSSSAACSSRKADFLSWPVYFWGCGNVNLPFTHFHFFFKRRTYQFCFFFSFLLGIAFPYLRVRGARQAGNRCLNEDDKTEGHWDGNENWHLSFPLWPLTAFLWLRALRCFHKREPNIYWGLLK